MLACSATASAKVRMRLDLYKVSDQRNRLAWPHRRQGLASDGVRYAGARSSVGRRFRSVTKLRLEWYGGVFLLLQQRSKQPRRTRNGHNAHCVDLTFCHTLELAQVA